MRAIARRVAAVDFLDSVGALRAPSGRLPRTGARATGPRRTRRGLRISRPRPALHRRGPAASVARAPTTATAPASLSRVSDGISRSAAGTQQTTSADQCPRPVGTTDATRPPHLTPSASPTPPRPRLLGGAGPRQRRRLRPFLASLRRHRSSPATAQALSAARSCPGLAHSPRGRAARTSPAARDSGRSAVAAANAPGQQCVRSRTTSGPMPRPVAAARRRIANTANLHRSSRRRRRAALAKTCWRRRTYISVDHTKSSRPAVPRAAGPIGAV